MAIANPTTNLLLERQIDGTNSSTWNQHYNANFSRLDQAIAGSVAIDVTAGDVTLTVVDSGDLNADDQARYAVIKASGTPGVARNVLWPASGFPASAQYLLVNTTGVTVTFKVTGLTGVTVAAGSSVTAYINGTDLVGASTQSSNPIFSGIVTVAGAISASGVASVASVLVTGSAIPINGAYLPATNSVGVSTNGTERFRWDSSGNFYANSATNNPIVNNVVGLGYTQSTSTLSIYSGTCPLNLSGTFNTQPVTQYFFNQTQVGSITITPSSVAYNTTSDYRLKTVFGPAATGLLIDAVLVHDAQFAHGGRRPMFLAHELQAAFPDAVTGTKDAVDSKGKPVMQMVDHQMLIPAMWAELRFLRSRVAALEIGSR